MNRREEECCAKEPDYTRLGTCRSEEPMVANDVEYPGRQKARDINIQSMDNGFLVRVGCQSFVFETAEKMITNLSAYLADPNVIEKSWFNGTLKL